MDLLNRTIPVELQREFSYFINEIIKSGVLLDEDIESVIVFYGAYEEKCDSAESCITWREIAISGLALTTALIAVRRKFPIAWVVLSLTPAFYTGGLVLKRIHYVIKRNKRRGNVDAVIQAFKDIPRLNRQILHYLKLKNSAITSDSEGVYSGFNVIIQNAMDQLFNGHINILNTMQQWIIYFSELVPILRNDYSHLIKLDLNSFRNYSLETLDKYYELYQNLCDVFVLFASGCLACFSLSLVPNLWLEDPNFREVFDDILPVMAHQLSNSYKTSREVFENMKYYFLKDKPKPIKFQTSIFEESSKLRQATYTSLSSMNTTIEKASAIFNMLEKANFNSQRNQEQILNRLRELQLDLNTTNTYMGLLINIYEVNLCKRKNQLPSPVPTEMVPETHVPETKERSMDYSTIDPDAAEDEEFEAVTTDSDAVVEHTAASSLSEDLDGYIARILSRELKEALTGHGRFVAARTKRGVVDETIILKKVSTVPPPPPPVMPELNLPPNLGEDQTEKPLFVPPPPLLPATVDPPPVTTTEETEGWTFLSALQSASKNRKITEEVFEADLENQ